MRLKLPYFLVAEFYISLVREKKRENNGERERERWRPHCLLFITQLWKLCNITSAVALFGPDRHKTLPRFMGRADRLPPGREVARFCEST